MSLLDLSLKRLEASGSASEYPWENAIDFFENPKFLNARLFPNQRLLLKLWNLQTDFTPYEKATLDKWIEGFQDEDYRNGVSPNVLDKIAKLKKDGWEWFPQIVAVLGRQAGKTFMTGLQLSYCIACFLWTENWGASHSALGHEPRVLIMATKESQAQGGIFKDLYNAVVTNPFFRPYILRALPTKIEFTTLTDATRSAHLLVEMRGKKVQPFVSLVAKPISSNVNSERGYSMPFFAFDEAFFAKQGDSAVSGNAAIEAMLPALMKFSPHSMAIFPSSPSSRTGKLYEIYLDGLKADNFDTLICQMPSWETYANAPDGMHPTAVPPDPNGSPLAQILATKEKADPYGFRVEYRGQFADSMHQYFNPDIVKDIFKLKGAVTKRQGANQYRIHCDPARVNDDFSWMVAHKDKDVLKVDWYGVFRASDFPSHTINYEKVEAWLQKLIKDFRPVSVTFDQFNSAFMVDRLNSFARQNQIRTSVKAIPATKQANREAMENLKREMGAGLVESYSDNLNIVDPSRSLLEASLDLVQEHDGKISKPRLAGYGHLDLVDCLADLCLEFSKEGESKEAKNMEAWNAWARSQTSWGF